MDDYISFVDPVINAGLIKPVIQFRTDGNKHSCEVSEVGPLIQTGGTSKTQAKKKAFKVMYERIRHEGLAGDLRVLPSGGFQLSQAKKRKSRGAKKRRTEKFIKKYNIKTVKCQVCGYPSNFKNNKTCRECQAPLEGESITAVYLDTKRAEGRANSDPIQLGLVKYCYSAGAGAGTLISKLQLNIWTDQKIDDWASRNCHKIKKRNGKMYQNGKHIPHMTQLQAMEEFENFLQGSEYLIAHGDVDFQTIRALLNKTKESPSYERVQKIDSQAFYKSVMWRDHRITKYGMKTIVQYFGDEATKTAYKTGAHGALCDAEAICSVSTSSKLYDRFKDWLMLEQSVEEEEVSVSHPARCQSTSRVMMYYPG